MKKVTNIRPLEVVEDGNRSVQYKGRDGKMHDIAAIVTQTIELMVKKQELESKNNNTNQNTIENEESD